MKATALQMFVKQVFSSEHQKDSFKADPAGFMSRFNLTSEEKSAILATNSSVCASADTAVMKAAIEPAIMWE